MKLVLFDIDGTLIDSGGAGVTALNRAFEDLFGISDAFRSVAMAGKTDLQIVQEGIRIHRLKTGNGVPGGFFGRYLHHLREGIGKTSGHVKPGVREALDALGKEEGVTLGLLTGNIEEGARMKLTHFGLDAYFPIGAYGNEHQDRNRLLPIAVRKYVNGGPETIAYQDCVVIGDTPLDVDCARSYGALAIAVATGPYSLEQLAATGPDALFQNLSDTRRLVDLVTGRGTEPSRCL
ncbi:MAG: HAD family hydrolase [Thermodesulfovibrionales bacterium]